jgi:hypothetical protein
LGFLFLIINKLFKIENNTCSCATVTEAG